MSLLQALWNAIGFGLLAVGVLGGVTLMVLLFREDWKLGVRLLLAPVTSSMAVGGFLSAVSGEWVVGGITEAVIGGGAAVALWIWHVSAYKRYKASGEGGI